MTLPPFEIVLLGLGVALLFGTWLPQVLFGRHVALPALYAVAGAAVYAGFGFADDAHPTAHLPLAERLSELTVVVSLFGAGLAIASPLEYGEWREPLRLLLIGMPLTILATGALMLGVGTGVVALTPAAALLFAACVSPTDPVLASSVSVPNPGGEAEGPVRFPLSGEAALNDGFAFPFVYLAIYWAEAGGRWSDLSGELLLPWLGWTLLGKLTVGMLAGVLSGMAAARVIFPRRDAEDRRLPIADEHLGTVVLGTVLLSYTITEAIGGYGFLAVFACGAAVRRAENVGEHDHALHETTETLERVLTAAVLFLFGAAVTALWNEMTWQSWAAAASIVMVIRPAVAMFSQKGLPAKRRVRLIVAFFGVRGVGSLYYLAYACGKLEGDVAERAAGLWPAMTATVLLSLLLHGVLATPAVSWAARLDGRVAEPEATVE